MTALTQDKALEFIFYKPIIEGLWDKVFNDSLTYDKDLSISFQEIFDLGYLRGVNLMKGQSIK